MFGDNLVERLKEELHGDFEEAILTLMEVSRHCLFCNHK